ncbi:UNVERIFIED_CONTAM: hypothetical protein Sangu_2925400 [Sesamum angustifolium]|uniref:Uncharacterized protein n=1 Tax=Sesamum angustifolium TaxID=2727405 RepID=A0AAW2IKN6_9LAMI
MGCTTSTSATTVCMPRYQAPRFGSRFSLHNQYGAQSLSSYIGIHIADSIGALALLPTYWWDYNDESMFKVFKWQASR